MLTIRLTRKGKKNQPFFRVVVVDKRRSSKGGRSVEEIGYFDPLTKRKSLNKERVLHWIKVGAQPSPTVHNLLVSEKILDAKKLSKHKKPKNPPTPKASEGQVQPETASSAAPAEQAKPEAVAAPAAPVVETTPTVETPVPGTPKEEPKTEPARNDSHSDAGGEPKPAPEK